MEISEHCRLCEKIVITLELKDSVDSLLELPHTFNKTAGTYEWRFYGVMAYALLPRAKEKGAAQIDMFLCIDEDDLDDIDVLGYARKFLRENVLPQWKCVQSFQLLEPLLSPPADIACRKDDLFMEMGNR